MIYHKLLGRANLLDILLDILLGNLGRDNLLLESLGRDVLLLESLGKHLLVILRTELFNTLPFAFFLTFPFPFPFPFLLLVSFRSFLGCLALGREQQLIDLA